MTQPNRVRRGVPEGGRFAPKTHREPEVGLTAAPASQDPGTAGPDELHAMAQSADPLVRAQAATGIRVTDDTLEELADPSQPVEVRLAAAETGYGESAERAARDPNPIVRALSLGAGVLSGRTRARLANDPQVQRFLGLIQA